MADLTRRRILGAAAILPLATPALAAFPDQPVRIIMPWSPGGQGDVITRALAAAMSGPLGQPVVVENRAGANGAVGAQFVARAAADGHTLAMSNAETNAINPQIYPKLGYGAADFTPVTVFARGPFALVTRPGFGTDTLEAFLARVRASPGRVSYASWGIGSTSHLAMEGLAKRAGLELLHVPFPGAAPAATAIVGGQVDAMFLNAGPAEAIARDGKVKILGVGAEARIPQLPNTPTLAELGMPIVAQNWFGLVGPARIPPGVAERIAALSAEAVKAPSVLAVFQSLAVLPVAFTPDQTRAFIASDAANWANILRDLNIRLE